MWVHKLINPSNLDSGFHWQSHSDMWPQAQPANVGQAARLGGVSPADIDSLLIHMEVQRRKMGVPRATVRMSTRQKREALMAAAGR